LAGLARPSALGIKASNTSAQFADGRIKLSSALPANRHGIESISVLRQVGRPTRGMKGQ
jgi:hypothetical protein